MKNLKVGAKILMGFGLVIALVLVLAVVTFLTSFNSINRITEADTFNSLQIEVNKVKDSMNDARAQAADAFTKLNAQDAYRKSYAHIDAALEQMESAGKYSDQLGGYKADVNAQLVNHIKDSKRYLQAVETNDAAMVNAIAEMKETMGEMNEKAVNVSRRTMSILSDNIVSDPDFSINYVKNNALPIQEMVESINELEALSATFVVELDRSMGQELYDLLSRIETQASVIRGRLINAESMAELDTLSSALSAYHTALNSLLDAIEDSDGKIASAQQSIDSVLSMITLGIEDVVADMQARMDGVILSSSTNLYTALGLTGLVIIASIIIALVLGKAITRPLKKMQGILLQVTGSGNLNFTDEVRDSVIAEASAKDELGQCLGAFAQFVDRIRYVGNLLEEISYGDLTQRAELLTEQDTLGNAINSMSDKLNEMFDEIQRISSQVAVSSNEIASGAQSLAQGATEQASTVQEISSSVSMINEQADISSKTAMDAARDSMGIRDIAQAGNAKMHEMIAAVEEINTASKAIEQVIKTIEDIAFQTNLLALNAAVEAAHAGPQGAGFAVVASEVKSLATRSAAATKETADLITANIEKAKLGMNICYDTAKSLEAIVEGIQRTAQAMEVMVQQSEGAKTATSQVNIAMEQVAEVVQQNSATSQESAAASQEMSSQAQTLRMLIGRFKLRDSDHQQAFIGEGVSGGSLRY